MDFRERVIKDFPSVFGKGDGEGGGLTASENFARKWGWYISIVKLADGKFLNMDEATSKPLFQALTFLSFEKERMDLEAKELKKKLK